MPADAVPSSFPRQGAAPRVAFQGALGAFSELALRQQWPDGASPVPRPTFEDTIAAVLAGDADFAVVPVENAIAGAVRAAQEALASAGASIVQHSELRVAIRLALLAPPGATLAGLRTVRSHAMALAQCRIFFARHAWLTPEPHEDTAGAAHEVAQLADPTVGAIASDAAAERYGLELIARQVQDVSANWTRFVVVGPR